MVSWLITNATTRDGRSIDIAIENGSISRISGGGTLESATSNPDRQYDAEGRLVTPPLIEPHIHLDATLTAGEPMWNESGTLAEGIRTWGERKESLTVTDVKARAEQTITWLAANGVTRVRTHADTTEESLTGVRALLELRDEVADLVDLQVVAFPQDGIFTAESHEDLLREALEMGADVVGGIPHNEHTREDGVASVELTMDLAESFDLPVDLHIDETDDPGSRFTEVLASEAIKRQLGDRVTASHATALHSYPNAYAAKLLSLLAESGVDVITNPPDNAVLQGRYDGYPRRRGHTRIDELQEVGVTVGIGHDSVMDPWYHYGRGDPLDAAFVLLHYAHMSGRGDVETIWEMLTTANASVFGVDDYGLLEGNDGSLVVYDAPDPFNALRTQASRTLVLKDGHEIARTEPASTRVIREGKSDSEVDFHR